jgi:hypothetical protein
MNQSKLSDKVLEGNNAKGETKANNSIDAFAHTFIDGSTYVSYGLTKREYFAAMAMQSALSDEHIAKFHPAFIADLSVKQADALIEALNK